MIEGMAGVPYKSKLNPYRAEIFTLRRQRKTYGEIAVILLQKYGIEISAGGLHNFIRSRIKNPAGPNYLGFDVPNFEEAAGLKPVVMPQPEPIEERVAQVRKTGAEDPEEPAKMPKPEAESESAKRPRKRVIYRPIVKEEEPNPFDGAFLNHEAPEE